MPRFLVYKTTTDDGNVFFIDEENLDNFAAKQFNAFQMEFTGFQITADNAMKAQQIFREPTKGIVAFIEEPGCTLAKSKVVKAIQDLQKQSIDHMIIRLTTMSRGINRTISVVAKFVYDNAERKGGSSLSIEEIHAELIENVAKAIKDIGYVDPEDGESPTTIDNGSKD